ncbi:hypothetical protein E4U17_007838 [Claviceps sp. LM77 group G4]|nr:hypothetical protein E4U17_007838 [Claviceps sp. LM77 group G4]
MSWMEPRTRVFRQSTDVGKYPAEIDRTRPRRKNERRNPSFDEPGAPQLRRAMCGLVAQVAAHLLPTTDTISDENAMRLVATEWTANEKNVEREIERRLNLTTRMAVVVERNDDETPWDLSTYEKTRDATTKGLSGRTMWEITREAIIQRGVLMGVVADMRASVAALDTNAVALIESHNMLARERASWKEHELKQNNMIRELQLELARAMEQPVRTTEAANRPWSM